MNEMPAPYRDLAAVELLVDARELRCPLPLLRLRQAMRDLPVGTVVELVATDRGSIKDVAAFAKLAGHALLGFDEAETQLHYWLRKGG